MIGDPTVERLGALINLSMRRLAFRYVGKCDIGPDRIVAIVEVRPDGLVRCQVMPDGDSNWVFEPSELEPL